MKIIMRKSDKTRIFKIKTLIEKLCLDAIQHQRDREIKLGYGLDDYTEGRIVGAAVLARKILSIIRQVN